MSMKITGGTARGRSIASPKGMEVRPTASKIRQAIFNILGRRLADCRFLDIFAGSGLMGIEALSRGARSLVAVEENKRLVEAIKTSLSMLNMEGKVYPADIRTIASKLHAESFDVIFADPPYRTQLGRIALELVDEHRLLAPGGLFVLEHLGDFDVPDTTDRLVRTDRRNYGQTVISFFERQDDAATP